MNNSNYIKSFILFALVGAIYFYLSKFNFEESIAGDMHMQKIKFSDCKIPQVKSLPDNSSIFIGHPYGEFILSKKVERFLDSNKKSIKRIFFGGDVIAYPDRVKWSILYNKYEDIDIRIAPGNHDVGTDRLRQIFEKSDFSANYPFIIEETNHNFIFVDTVNTNWQIDNKTIDYINKSSKPNIVIMHNIPIRELLFLANSHFGLDAVGPVSYSDFTKKINSKFKTVWVSGDSGAFEKLPRLSCKEDHKNKFITNGIGGIKGDKILIFEDGEIYSYEI